MKQFHLWREEDISGISGTGRVAEGVVFPNGRCVMAWSTEPTSIAIYESLADLISIHSHGGSTKVIMEDEAW